MNVTSAGWQVALCDPVWHVSSVAARLVAISCKLLYSVYLLAECVCVRQINITRRASKSSSVIARRQAGNTAS